MTEKVINNIRRNRNFTFIDKKPLNDSEKSNKQDMNKFQDVPSNGQDDSKKSEQMAFEMANASQNNSIKPEDRSISGTSG